MIEKDLLFDPDRGVGILTKSDREYLQEGEDYYDTKQAAYNKRADIRERLVNAILDFGLIFDYVEDRDLERVFDSEEVDNVVAVRDGIRDALALFYHASSMDGSSTGPFDRLLEDAVFRAESRDSEEKLANIISRISVKFEVIEPDPMETEVIAGKIKERRLYEMTEEEFRFYVLVQQLTSGTIQPGPVGEAEFLDNVERLRKKELFVRDEDE